MITRENVSDLFRYHPPTPEREKLHDQINTASEQLAHIYLSVCAIPSPELTMAVRKLQEARMWANAALTHNDPTAEVPGESH